MPIDALSVLCARLTRDLFAIAKFLFLILLNKVRRMRSALFSVNIQRYAI